MKKHRILAVALALASRGIGVAPSPASAAGQNSCLSGDACVSDWHSGSITYGWTGSVNNYNSYSFSNGHTVGNDVGYGRNRDSVYTLVCFFENTGRTGPSAGSAPYAGATWVLIEKTAESHTTTTASTC